MRKTKTGQRGLTARLLAVVLALSTSLSLATRSSAAPSRQDLEEAKAQLDALNEHLSLLVEQYDQAGLALQAAQAKLDEARRTAQTAQATAAQALADLNARAARAYEGVGSELDLLLSADSLSEFSDRMEFMGRIAQSDADLATRASTTRQRATWAADQLAQVVQERQAIVDAISEKEAEIKSGIADQEAQVASIEKSLEDLAAAQRAAALAEITGSGIDIGPLGSPPPAPNPNAQAAIDAAYSAIGTPYAWGGSSPENGFDCSGLTMWAWAHAGVSLPHSSEAQYAALPHVDSSQIQPGDLLFFYSPIHHVGLYIGSGRMIDSSHPGDVVNIRPVEWDVYVGAARPV